MWGRGTGKSHFMRLMMWLKLAEYRDKVREGALDPLRGIRIAWVMPTLKSFRQVHEKLLTAENNGPWKWLGGKLNRSTLEIQFPDGSWVMPVPAQDHTADKGGRGLRVDMVIGDEIDDIGLGVWDSVVDPWFTEPWSLGIRLVGGTPRRGRHGQLYRLFRLGIDREPGYHALHATYRDSPETVSLRAAEKAKRTTPRAVFAREWGADPDSAEGLVYSFDERIHVKEPPDGTRFSQVVVGVDHGWEHPGAFVLVGIEGDGEEATAWVLDEEYASQRPNQDWDKIARDWSKLYDHPTFYADPSSPDRIHDLRTLGQSSVREADNSVKAGLGRVADRLHFATDEEGRPFADSRPHLFVHPKCVNLIREFKSYKRKPDPIYPDRYMDDVIKRNDDCIAKGVAVTTASGTLPIEDIRPGELVLTRGGFRKVTRAWKVGTEQTWKLRAGNHVVQGTSEHRVWSTRGWIHLCDARPGDEVLVAIPCSSSSTVSASGDIRCPQGAAIASTTSGSEGAGASTERSGNTTTGASLTGSTSTISTSTRSTTRSETSSVSRAASIWQGTPRQQRQSNSDGNVSTSSESDRSPRLGIVPTRAARGTHSTGSTSSVDVPRFCAPASYAGSPTKAPSQVAEPDSAPTTASPPGGAAPVSTTSSESAPRVEPCSRSTGTVEAGHALELVRVHCSPEPSSIVDVYDLTVEDDHEFFAGGILVHNCMDALRYALMGVFGVRTGYSTRHEAPGA